MPKPDNNVLMRDAQDWLHELRGLQAKALARRDFVQAEELRAEGREPVRMGIGCNTGPAVVGNIGSIERD